MKAFYTYEERISNPNLPLINFEYLINHPEALFIISEKYRNDHSFRNQIHNKIKNDLLFAKRFKEKFPNLFNKKDIKR